MATESDFHKYTVTLYDTQLIQLNTKRIEISRPEPMNKIHSFTLDPQFGEYNVYFNGLLLGRSTQGIFTFEERDGYEKIYSFELSGGLIWPECGSFSVPLLLTGRSNVIRSRGALMYYY